MLHVSEGVSLPGERPHQPRQKLPTSHPRILGQSSRPFKLAPSAIARAKRKIFSPSFVGTTSDRAMLASLLEHSDAEGVCWPSHRRVQLCTGLSLATVKRAQARLEARGLVQTTRVMPGQKLPNGKRVVGQSVLYTLALDAIGIARDPSAHCEPSRQLTEAAPTPQNAERDEGRLFLPVKSSRSERHAHGTTGAAERGDAAPEARAVACAVGTTAMVLVAYWWRTFAAAAQSPDATACVFYDDAAARVVQERLQEGFTAEELRSAIDGAAVDKWRREAPHRTGLRVLLRDRATIYELAKAGRAAAALEARKQANEDRRRRQNAEVRSVAPTTVDLNVARAGAGALLAALGGAA